MMLKALAELHPLIAKDLEQVVGGALESDRARELFSGMFERGKGKTNVQKGAFGQALAQLLANDTVPLVVPPYIRAALKNVTN
jgi:putative ATP-dependent endonuclease of OLD family